jgi:hypothetical protein
MNKEEKKSTRGRKKKIHEEAEDENGYVDMELNSKISKKQKTEPKFKTIIKKIEEYCDEEDCYIQLVKVPKKNNKIDKVFRYLNCSQEIYEEQLLSAKNSVQIISLDNSYTKLILSKDNEIRNKYFPPNSDIVGHNLIRLPQ